MIQDQIDRFDAMVRELAKLPDDALTAFLTTPIDDVVGLRLEVALWRQLRDPAAPLPEHHVAEGDH